MTNPPDATGGATPSFPNGDPNAPQPPESGENGTAEPENVTTETEETEQTEQSDNWFIAIIKAIGNFFRSLFGKK